MRLDRRTAAFRPRPESTIARKFLYVIAAIILLVVAAGICWSLFQDRLIRWTFVPEAEFAPPGSAPPDYATAAAWLARPGLADDPSRWTPPGVTATAGRQAAIFYVPPTTYLSKARWNAPVDDGEANYRLTLFAKSQASVFNGVGAVWAPRYRQATFGAFLAFGDPRSARAIDFAYADVLRAFDAFVAAQPPAMPLVLAGHSQGSLHLIRLLHDRVAGRPLARRIVAVYAVGWPVSVTADLPALGLPACAAPAQTGCVTSWMSYAQPAAPDLVHAYFDATTGMTGAARRGTAMLCFNPLTGTTGGTAAAAANRGALVPHGDLAGADLEPGRVPAACTPDGLLSIGEPPEGYGLYVLPGNNYHVFDYALFWANLRADVAARTVAFVGR